MYPMGNKGLKLKASFPFSEFYDILPIAALFSQIWRKLVW